MSIDVPGGVQDSSGTLLENSPLQSFRMWEQQSAVNVANRLQRAGLLAPTGEVDRVLGTVLNNLEVTNNIYLDPPIRARVLLTTPLESIAVNHTILIRRGLIDVLEGNYGGDPARMHFAANSTGKVEVWSPFSLVGRMVHTSRPGRCRPSVDHSRSAEVSKW